MVTEHPREASRIILDKLHAKSWNAYISENVKTEFDGDRAITEGPANRLEVNLRYVLMPFAEAPESPESVRDALETLARKLNRGTPTITTFTGGREPLTGFRLYHDCVKLNTPAGTEVSYNEFVSALDTLVDTKTGRYE